MRAKGAEGYEDTTGIELVANYGGAARDAVPISCWFKAQGLHSTCSFSRVVLPRSDMSWLVAAGLTIEDSCDTSLFWHALLLLQTLATSALMDARDCRRSFILHFSCRFVMGKQTISVVFSSSATPSRCRFMLSSKFPRVAQLIRS